MSGQEIEANSKTEPRVASFEATAPALRLCVRALHTIGVVEQKELWPTVCISNSGEANATLSDNFNARAGTTSFNSSSW